MAVGLHGGPGDGQRFEVDRAPFYLRVVIDAMGRAVPLDSLEDAPTSDEHLAVYVRPGEVLRLSQPGGVWTVTASYVHLPDVDADALRDTVAWRAWASAQPCAGHGRVGELDWPLDPPPDA